MQVMKNKPTSCLGTLNSKWGPNVVKHKDFKMLETLFQSMWALIKSFANPTPNVYTL